MKNIVGILVAIVVLGGLIYLARPSGELEESRNPLAPLTASALIALDHSDYDLGKVSMAKGNVMHSFKIKNTGTSPVTSRKCIPPACAPLPGL